MISLLQRVQQLQVVLKSKFHNSNASGIKVGFKLPDGRKEEYTFAESATVKVSTDTILIVVLILQDLY